MEFLLFSYVFQSVHSLLDRKLGYVQVLFPLPSHLAFEDMASIRQSLLKGYRYVGVDSIVVIVIATILIV